MRYDDVREEEETPEVLVIRALHAPLTREAVFCDRHSHCVRRRLTRIDQREKEKESKCVPRRMRAASWRDLGRPAQQLIVSAVGDALEMGTTT